MKAETEGQRWNGGKIVRRLLPLLIAMIVVAAAAGIASRTVDNREVKSDAASQAAPEPMPQEETVDINGVACTPKKKYKDVSLHGS